MAPVIVLSADFYIGMKPQAVFGEALISGSKYFRDPLESEAAGEVNEYDEPCRYWNGRFILNVRSLVCLEHRAVDIPNRMFGFGYGNVGLRHSVVLR